MIENMKMLVTFLYMILLNTVLEIDEVELATCSGSNRHNCLLSLPKTVNECEKQPLCSWCRNQRNTLKCQTDDLSCIVPDHEEIPGVITQYVCEVLGGVFCKGDQSCKCVYPEPVRSVCVKKKSNPECRDSRGNSIIFENMCHRHGCVWCPFGTRPKKHAGRCFQKPAAFSTCSSSSGCCRDQNCLSGPFSEAECERKGCHTCADDNGNILCNFGSPPPPSMQCSGSSDNRFNCLVGRDKTLFNCLANPFCNWCPDLTNMRKCQTTNRACITPDHEEVAGGHNTKASCQANGGVFCDGDRKTKCVYPERIRSICLKKHTNQLTECTNVAARASEILCHRAKCVWCPANIYPTKHRNKCFERPPRVGCGRETCCREFTCLSGPNPNPDLCKAKGCHICTDKNGDDLCNFGEAPPPTTTTSTTTTPTTTTPTTTTPTTTTPTTTTPTTTTPTTTTPTTTTPTTTTPTTTTPTTTTPTTTTPTTTTPTTTTPHPDNCKVIENSEDCFSDTTSSPSETICMEMGCTWCRNPETATYICRRESFPDTCTSNILCPTPSSNTFPKCKSRGCEWCGSETSFADCQASTYCTTCDCEDRVNCHAGSAAACEEKLCLWCPAATDFKCMNLDSEGITTPGVWTLCSRTCGTGSQWQYDPNCNLESFYMCPRIHRLCNVDVICPPFEFCDNGHRPRHVDGGACCEDHTLNCGRNPYNTGGKRRKKRVVGGTNINTIENQPWLVVIYIEETQKCTGTLVSNMHVITHESCISGKLPADIVVNLEQYDRASPPTNQKNVASLFTQGDIGLIVLDAPVVTITTTVHPLCLPGGEFPKIDTDCIIAGWGITDPATTDCTSQAHEATVRTLSWGLCEQAWTGSGVSDANKYFCAGNPEVGGPDACTGDKGGPLMCQRCENCGWFLAGVATPYIGCGEVMKPTVYARVDAVEQWLVNNMAVPVLDPGPYSC
ncbi:uncharacterized protein LOC120334573 [Styela clava]